MENFVFSKTGKSRKPGCLNGQTLLLTMNDLEANGICALNVSYQQQFHDPFKNRIRSLCNK